MKLSYDKYPDLPLLLTTLLNSDISTAASANTSLESVFPALDIIYRAGIPSSYLGDMQHCISRHLGNRVWNVREMAARTISAITRGVWVEETIRLFQGIQEDTSLNHLHGILMTVKDILDRQKALDIDSAAGMRTLILSMTHADFA